MVSKRRQETLEDSEGEDIDTLNGEDERGTPLKRARTEEPEKEDEDEQDVGANVRVDIDETITDAELERMHEAAINEKLSQKAGKAGVSRDTLIATQRLKSHITSQAVAELGIIQQVDLINFLCHRNLTVKLIPQINFITGGFFPSRGFSFTLIHSCFFRSQRKFVCFIYPSSVTVISFIRVN